MPATQPTCLIISPALANANNGNWYTASRWQRFLKTETEAAVVQAWDGAPVDVLFALHARRSAASIAQFAARYPTRPLVVVLTGTDVYRDIRTDPAAQHALEVATHLVVLQEQALAELTPALRVKTRVILQSGTAHARLVPRSRSFDFVAVGHLRSEKDPLTIMAAARALPADVPIRVIHIGDALDAGLGAAASATMADTPHYRWLGGLPHARTRAWIARSRALILASRMEGGAHVIIEAVRSGVPVLASHISGNIGMLGAHYAGYFPPGDEAALTRLMLRFASDGPFGAHLSAQCHARAALFEPDRERQLVRQLFQDAWATAGRP